MILPSPIYNAEYMKEKKNCIYEKKNQKYIEYMKNKVINDSHNALLYH